MPKMTGSKLFAEMMRGYGVTHAFFVPTILMKALAEMESLGIKRIMTHGEKAAAYMADGYARASGRPGLCLAQQIGASNLCAGLKDAYLARVPLLAITGGSTVTSRYRHAYQELEDFSQFDSVTKFNAQVDDVTRLPDLLRQAFRMATSGSPGPVHLRLRNKQGDLPPDELDFQLLIEAQFGKVPPRCWPRRSGPSSCREAESPHRRHKPSWYNLPRSCRSPLRRRSTAKARYSRLTRWRSDWPAPTRASAPTVRYRKPTWCSSSAVPAADT